MEKGRLVPKKAKKLFFPKRVVILSVLVLLLTAALGVLLSRLSPSPPPRLSPSPPPRLSPSPQPQPGAVGHVYSAHPGDNLMQKARSLAPGDTLILTDGIYYVTHTAPGLRIEQVHGTAVAPIVIKAAHDGKAIIDGQNGAQGDNEPVFITSSSYVTVQGIVARNSYGSVVYVYAGTGSGAGPADHITLRRITAYSAGAGNNHVFNVSFGPTD